MRHKASLFPERYADGLKRELARVRSVRDFDDLITARFCGFRDAADYYAQSSAMRVLGAIRKPTLIVTAEDDPFVPFANFENAALRGNPYIRVVATRYGGHCAHISREDGDERFWAEARIVEFCAEHSTAGD
jgi:predicted alpha/beta-fold hydrolase